MSVHATKKDGRITFDCFYPDVMEMERLVFSMLKMGSHYILTSVPVLDDVAVVHYTKQIGLNNFVVRIDPTVGLMIS